MGDRLAAALLGVSGVQLAPVLVLLYSETGPPEVVLAET